MEKKTRHLLGLSGGKDSSALAVYMRDRVPEMEYFFTDTGKELPETYEFLDRLEVFLGKPIVRLNMDTDANKNRDFDHWLTLYGGLLPSSQVRWCTVNLKIRPFEKYVGEDKAYHYIAIRADEDRVGYKPPKTSSLRNIEPKIPLQRRWHHQRGCLPDSGGKWTWFARLLQVANAFRVLLLLLPTQIRVGGTVRAASRPL